ncbi:hypothetical protein DSUL_80058 [Desulfovibrionales bacterium]
MAERIQRDCTVINLESNLYLVIKIILDKLQKHCVRSEK